MLIIMATSSAVVPEQKSRMCLHPKPAGRTPKSEETTGQPRRRRRGAQEYSRRPLCHALSRTSRSTSRSWVFPLSPYLDGPVLADESVLLAISIHNYINPGAGLKHLEDWVQDSDFIFDSLFMNSTGPVGGNGYSSNVSGAETPCHAVPMVRTYHSEAAM